MKKPSLSGPDEQQHRGDAAEHSASTATGSRSTTFDGSGSGSGSRSNAFDPSGQYDSFHRHLHYFRETGWRPEPNIFPNPVTQRLSWKAVDGGGRVEEGGHRDGGGSGDTASSCRGFVADPGLNSFGFMSDQLSSLDVFRSGQPSSVVYDQNSSCCSGVYKVTGAAFIPDITVNILKYCG